MLHHKHGQHVIVHLELFFFKDNFQMVECVEMYSIRQLIATWDYSEGHAEL